MKNYRIIYWVSIVLMVTLGLSSCDTEYTDEDYIVGDAWHLVKTVHYVESRSHWIEDYKEYEKDDVSYKFFRNGDLRIRTTRVTRFGRVYADWIDGSWSLRGNELVMRTRDGVWYYEIGELSDWRMILVYYEDLENGGVERIEEVFER